MSETAANILLAIPIATLVVIRLVIYRRKHEFRQDLDSRLNKTNFIRLFDDKPNKKSSDQNSN